MITYLLTDGVPGVMMCAVKFSRIGIITTSEIMVIRFSQILRVISKILLSNFIILSDLSKSWLLSQEGYKEH